MNAQRKQNYKKAVKKGFKGTEEDYLKELELWHKAWGRKKGRVDGRLVWYERCLNPDCPDRKRNHFSQGFCRPCFEKTRRAYKTQWRKNAG